MNIENLKIVMIQDGIELGIIVPSNKMLAGVQNPQTGSVNNNDFQKSATNQEFAPENDEGSASVTQQPQTMVYEGEYDDGEHIDKDVKFVGIGVFVRKVISPYRVDNSHLYPFDVSTSDFVMRPVDIDFNFSLFFPHPPEKRSKRKAATSQQSKTYETRTETVTSTNASLATSQSIDSTGKRRRGKREKVKRVAMEDNVQTSNMNTPSTTFATTESPASKLSRSLAPGILHGLIDHRRASIAPDQQLSLVSTPKQNLPGGKRKLVQSSIRPIGDTVSTGQMTSSMMTTEACLPLAQPDDIESFYALATHQAIRSNEVVPRFDGKLTIGDVHVIFSTKHYDLINSFLAAGAKLRNGRPTVTIEACLQNERRLRRTSLETAHSASMSDNIFSDPDKSRESNSSLFGRHDLNKVNKLFLTKSEVIQLWWLYAVGSVVWELRQRKKLRKTFQRKFLSFSWNKHRFKRTEYINLYIAIRLQSKQGTLPTWRTETPNDPGSRLLDLEDQLCIEQILLYRSIARSAHVRGYDEMPLSILEILDHQPVSSSRLYTKSEHNDTLEDALKEIVDPSRRDSIMIDLKTVDKSDDGRSSFVSVIEERCEIARKRRDAELGNKLPLFPPFNHRFKANGRGSVFGADEMSHGFSAANQTIRTLKTTASTIQSLGSQEATLTAMLISFSIAVTELELIVTDETEITETEYEDDMEYDSEFKISSAGVSADSSILSELTTEDITYGDDVADDTGPREVDDSEPIVASTDYLLFKNPEKVILQLNVKTLKASSLGRSGGSRNINFTVGQILVSGIDGITLFQMGDPPLDLPPVNEIQVSKSGNIQGKGDKFKSFIPRSAVTMSLVDKIDDNFLQCDVSQVCCSLHYQSIEKILDLLSSKTAHFPQQLLRKTPQEDVRLYILQQNSGSLLITLNCSIRIHGLELFLPEIDHNTDTNFQVENGVKSLKSSKVRCGMIEIYSGTAVEGLRSSKADALFADPLESSRNRRKNAQHRKTETRQLRMLDVSELLECRHTLLSYNWVS